MTEKTSRDINTSGSETTVKIIYIVFSLSTLCWPSSAGRCVNVSFIMISLDLTQFWKHGKCSIQDPWIEIPKFDSGVKSEADIEIPGKTQNTGHGKTGSL